MAGSANPGFDIEEVPLEPHTISAAPTSLTAFVGRALDGPVNEAVSVHSWMEFEQVYGELWPGSTLGHSVRDFFVNGGSTAVVVRLRVPGLNPDGDALDAASFIGGATAPTQLASTR